MILCIIMRFISGMVFFFYFVEKVGTFHFVLVRTTVDHENLLNLKSFVVYSDFVKRRSFEYSF